MPNLFSKADVVASLEGRILSGELAPGERLPAERDLSLNYSVSRPVIREALAGLAELGLVSIHAGRGSFVREMSTDDLAEPLRRMTARAHITARHLVDARLMMETTAARLAAQRDGDHIDTIFALLEAHESATTLDSRVKTDLEFHEAIAAASGNPVITLMFGSIRAHVHALMLRSHSDPEVRTIGDPYHRVIAAAIRDKDPEAASAAMREHLELALKLYGDDLDQPLGEVLQSRGLTSAPPMVPRPRGIN